MRRSSPTGSGCEHPGREARPTGSSCWSLGSLGRRKPGQPRPQSELREACHVVDAQLLHHCLPVASNRLQPEVEHDCDFLACLTLRHEPQHLQFPRGQSFESRGYLLRFQIAPLNAIQKPVRYLRAQVRSALRDRTQRIEEIVIRKRAMGKAYTERLSELPELELQVEQVCARSVYWMYGLLVRETTGLDAAELARRLAARGIETRPFFFGMHEQPVMRERGLFQGDAYPVTERLARQGLYLPSGLTLQTSQIDEICDAVREALQ